MQVAKEASRVILADDNFATIVAAVAEGRRVYDNLRKVLCFVLPTNVAQGFCILVAICIGMPEPLNALQVRGCVWLTVCGCVCDCVCLCICLC